MKKAYFVTFTALCMLLAACAKEDPLGKIAQAVEEGETIVVSTPYADLKVPEVFQDNVMHEVICTEPYTLSFKMSADSTELFSVILAGRVIFYWVPCWKKTITP